MLAPKYNTSKTLLSTTFLMLILPILSYFFSRRIFKGKKVYGSTFLEYFEFSDSSAYIASAIMAVLMVHGVLVGVIILAYREEQQRTIDDKKS